jgi:arginyl-tRNA--protein-N-Asp/Glu arginylyltransferase
MTDTVTFELPSFYVTYAPEAEAWSYGTYSDEAINSLAD